MSQYFSPIPQGLQAISLLGVQHQLAVTLTPEQLRTGNSVPVIVVPSPGPTSLIVLMTVFYSHPSGTVYSGALGAIHPKYTVDGTTIGEIGSAPSINDFATAQAFFANYGADTSTYAASDIDFALNDSISFFTAADRTGGDTGLTLIVDYVVYNLDGII